MQQKNCFSDTYTAGDILPASEGIWATGDFWAREHYARYT